MESYEALLQEAYKKVKTIESKERFTPPEIEAIIEGNKTIIANFPQICSYLRREQEHVAKFLLRELATPGLIENNRLILSRKIMTSKIGEKLNAYINEFVICRECKKPDTELIRQEKFMFIKCSACGAKHSVRAKIQ